MTTCDDSTVYGTVGHVDITGFYAYRDLYDEDFLRTTCNDTMVYGMGGDEVTERSRDDIAMKIYFSACNGHKHDYALLGYFCACSQNFGFAAGYSIYSYNLLGTALDDAVVDDSGRKDPLNISTLFLLWTASIIMIAAFVLYLSTTTSTTTKVGMKDISTGLVKVFGMIRFNLLEGRNTFERKGGSAIITSERNNDCKGKDAYIPIMSIHGCERLCLDEGERIRNRVRFCLDECEQVCPSRFLVSDSISGMKVSNVLTVLSNMGGMITHQPMVPVIPAVLLCDPLFVYVLQCLVRSRMDHRDESHRVCSAASVMSKHGQQIRLYARTSSHSSHTSCYARTLEDQFAWSSRTCMSLS